MLIPGATRKFRQVSVLQNLAFLQRMAKQPISIVRFAPTPILYHAALRFILARNCVTLPPSGWPIRRYWKLPTACAPKDWMCPFLIWVAGLELTMRAIVILILRPMVRWLHVFLRIMDISSGLNQAAALLLIMVSCLSPIFIQSRAKINASSSQMVR